MTDKTSNTPLENKPETHRAAPGPVNKEVLAELTRDRNTIRAVSEEMKTNSDFVTRLNAYKIDRDNTVPISPARVGDLLHQADAAVAAGGGITTGQAALDDVTDEEENKKQALIESIRAAGAAAKTQYEETNRSRLKAYWVGEDFKSRAKIEEASTAIYELVRTTDKDGHPVTPQDTLPGFDQAAIDLLAERMEAYLGIEVTQGKAKTTKRGAGTTFAEQAAQIGRRRRKLQLAINSAYAPGPENAAFREQFDLPGTKQMS